VTLPSIHVSPFIGAKALYKIATLDPVAGDAFGVDKRGRDVQYPLAFGPIDEMFGEVHPAEAMFVCYRRRNSGPLPRLTKACEGRIDLVCDFAAFDVDLNAQFGEKGKLSWAKLGPERETVMANRLAFLRNILIDEDAQPLCYYRSKNGLRFVHLFHEPLTTAGLELAYTRLARHYAHAGITVDAACFDWTRNFKVPRCILEDGTQTDLQPWFHMEWSPNAVTIATLEELTALPGEGHAGDVLVETRLEVGHARELIELDGKLTPDGLDANQALRSDPELFNLCFGSIPFSAPEGTRHTSLTKLVGRLTKRCVAQPWASEQFLYALLAPKIADLGDPDFLEALWEMTCSYLAADRTELAAKVVAVREEVTVAPPPPSAMKIFADGVRKWCPDAVNLDDDQDVVDLVKDTCLAIATSQEGNQSYLLQSDGFYGGHPVAPDKLPLLIRQKQMQWLVPTEIESTTSKGEPRISPRTWTSFLNENARTYATTRMLCVHRGNYMTKDESGEDQFIISPFWLRDLGPKFDQKVEEWLQLAAKDGEGHELVLALAYLLAFKWGPTAAVALIGPRSVGKKLIATGLAECINTLQCCPGGALVSRFNGALTTSPIIWVDEGLPRGKDGIDFADRFRNLVTGGKLDVERKGKEVVQVAGVHRVLITANNYDAISKLGEDAPRTQDDLDAISERLVVFELQQRAADFLGKTDTRGWIAGDNGAPSNYTIARHLMWHLYNTVEWEDGAPKKCGRRLLYEGMPDGLVQQKIDGADSNIPEIAMAINDMARAGQVHLRDAGIYVNPDVLKNKCTGLGKNVKPSEFRKAATALAWDSHNTTIENVSARWLIVSYQRFTDIVSQITTVAPQIVAKMKELAQ
jgi:hypothetical protein